MTKILVDNKEPKEILEALHEMKIPCEYTHLEVGDYIIGKTVIERKTIKDFKNSIIDNRLWNQAKALSLNNGNKIIVVIGYPYLTSDYPIVFGAISSLILSFGINVLMIPSEAVFLHFLKAIWRRESHQGHSSKPIKKLKWKTLDDIRINMLCQIPGLGYKTSVKLLNEYGSIFKLLEIDSNSLKSKRLRECISLLQKVVKEKYGEEKDRGDS